MELSWYDKKRAKQFKKRAKFKISSEDVMDEEEEEEEEEEENDINDDEHMWRYFINPDGSVSNKGRKRIHRSKKNELQYPVYESNDFKSLGKNIPWDDCDKVMELLRELYSPNVDCIEEHQHLSIKKMHKISKVFGCGILANPSSTGQISTMLKYYKSMTCESLEERLKESYNCFNFKKLTSDIMLDYIKSKTLEEKQDEQTMNIDVNQYFSDSMIVICPTINIKIWEGEIYKSDLKCYVYYPLKFISSSKACENCDKIIDADIIIVGTDQNIDLNPLLDLCSFQMVVMDSPKGYLLGESARSFIKKSKIKWILDSQPYKNEQCLNSQLDLIGLRKKKISIDGLKPEDFKLSDSENLNSKDLYLLDKILISIDLDNIPIISFESKNFKELPVTIRQQECVEHMKLLREMYNTKATSIDKLQKESVQRITDVIEKYGTAILSNPTGTGKTRTILKYCKLFLERQNCDISSDILSTYINLRDRNDARSIDQKNLMNLKDYYLNTIVIICPITLFHNWEKEIELLGLKYLTLHGYKNISNLKKYKQGNTEDICQRIINSDIIIVSPCGFLKDPIIELFKFNLVIVDESNTSLEQLNAIKYLKKSRNKLLVSATPYDKLQKTHPKDKKNLVKQLELIGFHKKISIDGGIPAEFTDCILEDYSWGNPIKKMDLYLLNELVITKHIDITKPKIIHSMIKMSENEKQIYELNCKSNKKNIHVDIFDDSNFEKLFKDFYFDGEYITFTQKDKDDLRSIWFNINLYHPNGLNNPVSLTYAGCLNKGIFTSKNDAEDIAQKICNLEEKDEKPDVYHKIVKKIISLTMPIVETSKMRYIFSKIEESISFSIVNGIRPSIMYVPSSCFKLICDKLKENGVKTFGFNGDTPLSTRRRFLSSFERLDSDLIRFNKLLNGCTLNFGGIETSFNDIIGGIEPVKDNICRFLFRKRVMVLTPGIGSEGLNLQNASQIFCPFIFSNEEIDQIKGRICRYGQESKEPEVHLIGYKNTFEEYLNNNINKQDS